MTTITCFMNNNTVNNVTITPDLDCDFIDFFTDNDTALFGNILNCATCATAKTCAMYQVLATTSVFYQDFCIVFCL